MGKGRKTRAFPLKEKSQPAYTVSMSGPARNLREDKLEAVIFGCKNHTIGECLDNKIFGLPASHHSYVKNVRPGLTLYLFNYSDRKLHGIFEAVSTGQMNLNPHAWIASEGVERTPYPSQVRVTERRQCRPLLEKEFQPVLANNYYEERLFWFELDHKQNTELMKLFLSSSLPKNMHRLLNATEKNDTSDVLSSSIVNENAVEKFKGLEPEEYPGIAKVGLIANEDSSISIHYKNSCSSEKKWSELFKPSSSSCMVKQNEEGVESQEVGLISSVTDSLSKEGKFASLAEGWGEPPHDLSDVDNWEDRVSVESDIPDSRETSSENREYSDEEGGLIPSELDSSLAEGKALLDTKEKIITGADLAILGHCDRNHDQFNLTSTAVQDDNNTLPVVVPTDVQSSDNPSLIAKLVQEVAMLKLSHEKQRLRIERLEHELVHPRVEMNQLASPDLIPEESVFIIGGFDGCSWLSDLSLYSRDKVVSLCPMTFTRSFFSVAKLNGELYSFGGFRNGVWYDTVESYNPINNRWFQRPCLTRKKGCMAGVSFYETIFAIGGNNATDCFSEVELFDLQIGSWVPAQPMLEKRSGPAAANLNGTLYVAGGYNGRDYMRSFERLDLRTRAWIGLAGMNMGRGGHALAEFNEKLYAIGGSNGERMMSSVEVYDARKDSWMMAEPMNVSRGYFGSFVHAGRICCIGGMQQGNQASDQVECYNEDCGWQEVGATALGKRALFSALVL